MGGLDGMGYCSHRNVKAPVRPSRKGSVGGGMGVLSSAAWVWCCRVEFYIANTVGVGPVVDGRQQAMDEMAISVNYILLND